MLRDTHDKKLLNLLLNERTEKKEKAFVKMKADAEDVSKWTLPKYLALSSYLDRKPNRKKKTEFAQTALFKKFKDTLNADYIDANLSRDEKYTNAKKDYIKTLTDKINTRVNTYNARLQRAAATAAADSSKAKLLIRLSL